MADKLTEQQRQVVEDQGGTLLVSAAAGSGKTKVLVDRVLRRITQDHCGIDQFLIITFTNAAAAELRAKIAGAISLRLAQEPENQHLTRQLSLLHLSQISTVHAFCGALIRQYGYRLRVPADYRMLDENERAELLERQVAAVLEEAYAAAEPDFLLLVDTLGAGRGDEGLSTLIKQVYEDLLTQPDPQEWLSKHRDGGHLPADTDLAKTPWGELLIAETRQKLQWLIQRYRWAVTVMAEDEVFAKYYLPTFREELDQLEAMLPALDLPWDEIAPALTLALGKVRLPNGQGDKDRAAMLRKVRSDGVDQLEAMRSLLERPAEELRAEQNRTAPAVAALLGLVERLDQRFSREKRRRNLLDFSDQEHLAIRLLYTDAGDPSDVALEVASRYREIMVDEYQDSNRVQERIFTAIAPGDRNRFLVGDVKQSIYGFRQAEPDLFLDKYGSFVPGGQAAEGEPRKLVLSKNFRSRPEILEAVNHTFETVMSQEVGELVYGPDERLNYGLDRYPATGRTHVELHLLDLERLPEDQEERKYRREAEWVAERIAALLRDGAPIREGDGLRPVRPEDIAILFRVRDPIATYAGALREAGIPVAADSGESLFDTQEVQALTAVLETLNNPHQDIPLLATLCSPLFRLSNAQLAEIRVDSDAPRFYDAMRACQAPWCRAAVARLEAMRRQAGTLSADALVWWLLQDQGLLAAYSAMENGKARRENLLAVYQLALQGTVEGHVYLYQLLRRLDRAREAGVMAPGRPEAGVILTTIHASKGLEYPVVFLADLSRRMNFRETKGLVLFDRGYGLVARITDNELRIRYPGLCYRALKGRKERQLRSEELRILYVAMTRPRDYLIMTCARSNGASALSKLLPGVGRPAAVWASSSVSCLGDWLLLAAMNRIEAGELFRVCGRPDCDLAVTDHPWTVTYQILGEREDQPAMGRAEPSEPAAIRLPDPGSMAAALGWTDPHHSATVTPSKLTATQLKGRAKDAEAAEGARVQASLPSLRRPEFVTESQGLSPTERGTAVHLFLQYADYRRCLTREDVEAEKDRMETEAYMTAQQLEAVDPEMILRLFHAPLGQRILGAERLIREFKFSLLEDAAAYYPGVGGERLLLQGVVDAAILEPDGIQVIDFKTDRVTEQSAPARAEGYRGQMTAYKRALERIFHRPVTAMSLYFLTIGQEVRL